MNLPGIAGLNAALAYIQETGLDKIYQTEMALCARFLAGARTLKNVRIAGIDG